MKKITIQIRPGIQPFQLEGFVEGAERSVEGSLHFCGGTTKTITEDEFEALKKARPELVATGIVVAGKIKRKKAPPVTPVVEVKEVAEGAKEKPSTSKAGKGGKK